MKNNQNLNNQTNEGMTPAGLLKADGTALKKAREAKGLSLESVHEVTKIPLDALRAIEEGYTVRTLSSFYYKGFIKIYAQYLDVELSNVVSEPTELRTFSKENKTQTFSTPNFMFPWKPLIAKIFPRKIRKQIAAILFSVLLLFIIYKSVSAMFAWVFSLKSKQPPQTKQYKKEAKKETQNKKEVKKEKNNKKKKSDIKSPAVVTAEPASNKRADTLKKADQVQISRGIVLTVRARKNCWLRVMCDRVIVFQSSLRLGAVETWIAKEGIEITGKNITHLEFELNGDLIGTLGRESRNAKKIVVNKDGISITK